MLEFTLEEQAHVDALDAAAPPLSPAQLSKLAALIGGKR
jgi:hypothetical protein